MPSYRQDRTSKQYKAIHNTPALDRVCFTLDHIHSGEHGLPSTYEVVKFLVDKRIPVTVFMQATSPSNNYELDRNNARLIYNLAPHLVTLGLHPLSAGNSQQRQTKTQNIISEIIQDVTGKKPNVLSYHGAGAGPEPHIRFPGIKYCRGIGSAWAVGADQKNDTPVIVLNSVTRALNYAQERNAAGLSATVFIHTQELIRGSSKKRIFDTFVKEVQERRLHAVSYYDAMEVDFKVGHQQPLPRPTPETQPRPNPPNPRPESNSTAKKASLRLSALTEDKLMPITARFYVQKTNGEHVASGQDKSKQFRIPEGKYKVTAKVSNIKRTKTLTLSARKGVHHVFFIPEG